MSSSPVISVLISVHNEELYLGRALRSLLNQSIRRKAYEIILINDASTDNTQTIINAFISELVVIENEKQLGLPASLNKGIKKARGKYFIRLDGDDFVHADFLQIPHMFLEMNPDMDAVAMDYLTVDASENVTQRENCEEKPIACGIMFRSDHLIRIGMYDDNFLMHEDSDLRIRFLEHFSIQRIPLPLYRYRKHEGNMTRKTEQLVFFEQKLNEKHGHNG